MGVHRTPILLADDLERPSAWRGAIKRVLNQNLALSAVATGALEIGAVSGALTLPGAVLAHEIGEFIVIGLAET